LSQSTSARHALLGLAQGESGRRCNLRRAGSLDPLQVQLAVPHSHRHSFVSCFARSLAAARHALSQVLGLFIEFFVHSFLSFRFSSFLLSPLTTGKRGEDFKNYKKISRCSSSWYFRVLPWFEFFRRKSALVGTIRRSALEIDVASRKIGRYRHNLSTQERKTLGERANCRRS